MGKQKRETRAEKRRREREQIKNAKRYGRIALDALSAAHNEESTETQQDENQKNTPLTAAPFAPLEPNEKIALEVMQIRMRATLQAEYDRKERDMKASYEDAERRMRAFYEGEAQRISRSATKQLHDKEKEIIDRANAEMKAMAGKADDYERKCRAEYDEHMLATKEEIKNEVIGDTYAKAVWVLHNNFKFTPEQLRLFLLESIRFDIFSTQPENGISINYVVKKLNREGFNLDNTISEVGDQAMDEEDERLAATAQEHEGWTVQDEQRMAYGITIGVSYDRIGRWIAKSGGAVKMRAYRKWGTTSQQAIRDKMGEKDDAKKCGALPRPDSSGGVKKAAG